MLGLEKDRLYPSIYGEDDEAFDIWTKEVGVPGDRITRFYRDPKTGECDNFGSMEQVLVVLALRFTTTAVRSTAVASLIVR